MKNIPNFILIYLLIAVITGLAALFYFAGRNNTSGKENALKREARKAYLSADYKKAFQDLKYLVDSLAFKKDEARLNLAHAGYLGSRFDSTGNLARDIVKDGIPVDSAAIQEMKEELNYAECLDHYLKLSETSGNKHLGSIAYNQLGIITYNFREMEEAEKEEEAMAEAAGYFKSALKKDPSNEAARYNYELIRRRIDYPEMIMQTVRSLIHQRKYKEARNLLKNALEEESRMRRNYGDYMQRIETIISIDSVARS